MVNLPFQPKPNLFLLILNPLTPLSVLVFIAASLLHKHTRAHGKRNKHTQQNFNFQF